MKIQTRILLFGWTVSCLKNCSVLRKRNKARGQLRFGRWLMLCITMYFLLSKSVGLALSIYEVSSIFFSHVGYPHLRPCSSIWFICVWELLVLDRLGETFSDSSKQIYRCRCKDIEAEHQPATHGYCGMG